MGLQIEDGKGSGISAQVDINNRLQTFSVIEEKFAHASEDGDAYSWSNVTYDYSAGDTILLVRNDSSDDLYIDKIYMQGDTATSIIVHCPTTTFTIAGTAVTGVNMNRKSGTLASATAKSNETGNTQGDIIFRGAILANDIPYKLDLKGSLILGNGHSVGVDYVTNGAACLVVIFGHY